MVKRSFESEIYWKMRRKRQLCVKAARCRINLMNIKREDKSNWDMIQEGSVFPRSISQGSGDIQIIAGKILARGEGVPGRQ